MFIVFFIITVKFEDLISFEKNIKTHKYACKNIHKECENWLMMNTHECANNPSFMHINCRKSCNKCDVCNQRNTALLPGLMSSKIKRIVNTTENVHILSQDPWILYFDDFVTDVEIVGIQNSCTNYTRSLAGSDSGITESRTSSTCWCYDTCTANTDIKFIRQRISDKLGIHWENAEHFQFLKYERDQYYKSHHDQNAALDSAWGPRIFTFFIYLSDVESGGHTYFNRLSIRVPPKKGAAILWPSVMDNDPYKTDYRTFHEAMPVIRGTKFAINIWFHLYNFQIPHKYNCL